MSDIYYSKEELLNSDIKHTELVGYPKYIGNELGEIFRARWVDEELKYKKLNPNNQKSVIIRGERLSIKDIISLVVNGVLVEREPEFTFEEILESEGYYKPIAGFENYLINRKGDIYSSQFDDGVSKKYRRLQHNYTWQSRPYVTLVKARKDYMFFIHQLVAREFIGPRPEGMLVCHNNGNGLDNRVENLRYDTLIGNMADKYIHGTIGHKLTIPDVLEIKRLLKAGMLQKEIANRFNVDDGTISSINCGTTWSRIKLEDADKWINIIEGSEKTNAILLLNGLGPERN